MSHLRDVLGDRQFRKDAVRLLAIATVIGIGLFFVIGAARLWIVAIWALQF